MTNIKARRKLSDLYRRGVELRFGPGEDGLPTYVLPEKGEGYLVDEEGQRVPLPSEDWVQAWVQPPSPLHREMAMRDAQAARAKSLIRAKREKDSEEHLTIMAFLADMDDETLIDYLLVNSARERREAAMREVLAEDEWKDFPSYQDAIRQYEEDPRPQEEIDADPDYIALLELDTKFGDQVADRERQLLDAERDTLKMRPRENLERKALDSRAEIVGTQAFMYEYELQMTYYSVRDFDNNGVMFFESARELAEQDDDVRNALREAMSPFITDAAEAKNSLGAVSGSESSEPPSEPEITEASIPETASA
jgi:hypothetical protein